MSIFTRILEFLGLKKRNIDQVPVAVKRLMKDLQKSNELERVKLMEQAQVVAKANLDALNSFKANQPADPKKFLSELCENFDVLTFIFQHRETEAGNVAWRDGIDPVYEQLLELLPDKISALGRPVEQLWQDFEDYLERFEDQLLLSDARADFLIRITENKKWIIWPFVEPKLLRASRQKNALQRCRELFLDLPSLRTLDFENRVPSNPVSFLEVKTITGMRGVNVADFANNKFYTYLV